jgi:pre-mRNA-splicing factor RBM22/SLT11
LSSGIDLAPPGTASRSSQPTLTLNVQRNRARLCTFFAKGGCKRGAECPYRHEMPEGGELANQNIRDRYYGINDPVAKKMMGRLGERQELQPPEDPQIMTLYVGNIEPDWNEQDLRDVFEKHGTLTRVRVVHGKSCAFVTFSTRQVRIFLLHRIPAVRVSFLKILA